MNDELARAQHLTWARTLCPGPGPPAYHSYLIVRLVLARTTTSRTMLPVIVRTRYRYRYRVPGT
eukprot:634126-Rhodomonas_salina.1